ncbi:hypothetical protein SAMD00023353_2000410 [Rosellinia necatrix]|uniref:Uncharacterized protein n=1 Tax=Rosellinia necatrix TaxID=77044 RepID=A0A1W2TF54_ROSNE|nr:hypothetical protein SAMD00023353_2000410 [Rosellinia necatrix]
MSANRNPDSLKGEFHSRVPPSEPLEKGGHKPGVLVGNDKIPEFHAEAYPAGTAPRENTFQPRPEGEYSARAYGTAPRAEDTMQGATSQDVYRGMGKPIQGQEAREIEKRHGAHNKKEGTGVAGVGGSQGVGFTREAGFDLPGDTHKGMGVKESPGFSAAEDRVPTSAEELASRHK